MKIWITAVALLVLSGCANTTWQELSECRSLNPEDGACVAEWVAYNEHEARKARKEAEREALKCPFGSGRVSDGRGSYSGCISNHDLKEVLRSYGY